MLTLLRDLARTVDGYVYAATHLGTGPTVNLYTMADRPAVNKLSKVGGVIVIIPGSAFDSVETGVTVSACAVELEPIRWRQTVNDLATIVAVDWREQTKDTDGNWQPTDRTVTQTDPAQLAAFGARRLNTRTELTLDTSAAALADGLME